ncbi:MAG: FAD:protein FMN transferase, partial [Candidatus Humimicrobiaceae bacterium]
MDFNLSSDKSKVFYFVIFTALTIILLTFNLTTGCNFRTFQKFQENREMMGTFISITVYAAEEDFALGAIDSAFRKIKEVEEIASIYSEQSEVSFLNKNGYIDNPSAELYELITESKNYTEVTDGAFDITVQPILELWETGLWKEEENVQKQKISDALNLVGSDMISIDVNRIEFEKEGMSVTLGGIAKGYAVDQAMEVLKNKGIEYALVDAGGDIMASGEKPDGSYWTIALQNPDKEDE